MKRLLLGLVLLTPAVLFGQNAFNGTWRFSAQSGQFGGKPDTFSLQNGAYRCDSCDPKVEVTADGQDHERTGSPYSDTINVRVVDDNTVETTTKKGGKVVGTSKETVSPDGNTLTTEWTYVSDNGKKRKIRLQASITCSRGSPPDLRFLAGREDGKCLRKHHDCDV